jgi:glycogen debranching enzyme
MYGEVDWDIKKILEISPFRVVDPMTNSILLRSDKCLLELAEILNITDHHTLTQIKVWIEQTKNGLESLWSETDSTYYAKDLCTETLIKIDTVSSLIPLFSEVVSKDHAYKLAKKIINMNKDKIYLVPSTSPYESSYFEPDRYWRGPTWIITNELVATGLDFYEQYDLAKEVRMNSLALILNTLDTFGGFYEYYNPITGKGLGSPKQSWTAAAVLNILKCLETTNQIKAVKSLVQSAAI